MTRTSVRRYKTGLLRTAGALFVMCALSSPAAAQYTDGNDTAELLNRINQLENQVQTMSRSMYRDGGGSRGFLPQSGGSVSSAPAASATAGFEVRMTAIEDAQRNLTGQIEKINFDVQQMKNRLDRMQADTDQRFQQQAAPPPPPQPAPVATPQPQAQQLGTLGGSTGHSGPAEEMYEKAFASIRAGNYDSAQKQFQEFMRGYPGHPLASNAQYWLGETYYVRGEYKMSAKTFAEGYQNFPKGPKAQDSLLKLGLSLSKLGRKDDACLSLQQLQKEVPDEANPLRAKAAAEIKQLACQ